MYLQGVILWLSMINKVNVHIPGIRYVPHFGVYDQRDEVLVRRVEHTKQELAGIANQFSNLSSQFKDMVEQFAISRQEADKNVSTIQKLNDELTTDLQKSGTDLESQHKGRKHSCASCLCLPSGISK